MRHLFLALAALIILSEKASYAASPEDALTPPSRQNKKAATEMLSIRIDQMEKDEEKEQHRTKSSASVHPARPIAGLQEMSERNIVDLAKNSHWWFRFWDKASKYSEALTKVGYIATGGYTAYATAKTTNSSVIGVDYVDGIIIAALYAGTKGMNSFTRYCAKESKQRLGVYNKIMKDHGGTPIDINPEDDVNSDLDSQSRSHGDIAEVIEALTPNSLKAKIKGDTKQPAATQTESPEDSVISEPNNDVHDESADQEKEKVEEESSSNQAKTLKRLQLSLEQPE